MMTMIMNPAYMANMMAEDTGAMELRNPLTSGMQKRSWLRKLFARK